LLLCSIVCLFPQIGEALRTQARAHFELESSQLAALFVEHKEAAEVVASGLLVRFALFMVLSSTVRISSGVEPDAEMDRLATALQSQTLPRPLAQPPLEAKVFGLHRRVRGEDHPVGVPSSPVPLPPEIVCEQDAANTARGQVRGALKGLRSIKDKKGYLQHKVERYGKLDLNGASGSGQVQ